MNERANRGPHDEGRAATLLAAASDPSTAATDPAVATFLERSARLLGAEAFTVLDLHWRQHLPVTDMATTLALPIDRVTEQVARLPRLFGNLVRARILWAGGKPAHDMLADELTAASIEVFDTGTARLIFAHTRTCAPCRRRAATVLDPIEVYAAIPLPPAPPAPPVAPSMPVTPIATRPAPGPRAPGPPAPGAGPAHPPVPRHHRRGDSTRRLALLGALVAVVLVAGVVGFASTRTDAGTSRDVDTEDNTLSPATVENQQFTTTSTLATTTTQPATTTVTTTLAPTTTAVPDALTAGLTVDGSALVTRAQQGFPVGAVVLSWQHTFDPASEVDDTGAAAPHDRRVTVSGAGVGTSEQPASGALALCPSAETVTCNVIAGDYPYTVELFVDGVLIDSTSVTLTVTPR